MLGILWKVKREMKKLFAVLAVAMVFVMVSGVIAAPKTLSDLKNSLPDDAKTIQKFVEGVAKEKGLNVDENTKIEKVDFKNLPEAVNLQNIDDTNLAVYSVDDGQGEPVYVLTLSGDTFNKLQDSSEYRRMVLNFGYSGTLSNSQFLETATGVEGSTQKGYVMMRDGSITGMSTNLDVVTTSGETERIGLVIYKNGKPAGFGNSVDALEGVQNDYDVQSENTLNFEAGDVISVYLDVPSNLDVGDITTLLEITVGE